jgi:pentatricopeptide repeat protein
MYIVIRCPKCRNLILGKTENKTRLCPHCGNRAKIRTLRVYGRARSVQEAVSLIQRLKEKDIIKKIGESNLSFFKDV